MVFDFFFFGGPGLIPAGWAQINLLADGLTPGKVPHLPEGTRGISLRAAGWVLQQRTRKKKSSTIKSTEFFSLLSKSTASALQSPC